MKEFFDRLLNLPEVKLFIDYWFIWIPLAILLLVIDRKLRNSGKK